MGEESKTAYEALSSELVDRFMKACARAGVSNSGLCMDPSAGADIVQMNYLRGAVLARMDGQKPPFKSGKVGVKEEVVLPIRPRGYDAPCLKEKRVYTIDRVWYDGGWYLTFKELSNWSELKAQYPATQFYSFFPSTPEVAPAAH